VTRGDDIFFYTESLFNEIMLFQGVYHDV